MARSCGIRLGQQRFEIVVLEGSSKKAKVIAAGCGEIPAGPDPLAATVDALREAAKRMGVTSENVGLAVDTGMAAFRNVTLPFDDRAKIEEVIKFEVESQLPQWSIDEVVIDFLSLSTKPAESRLLVTAVPKAGLRQLLDACERSGLPAFDAELEATAVLNAAHAAGLFEADGAQILVHVGESASAIMVVDGGVLRSMRAIHIGGLPPRLPAVPESEEAAPSTEDDKAGDAPKPAERPLPTAQESAARLRRELGRTILGTQTDQPLRAVYCAGIEIEGLLDEAAVGAPVRRFEPFQAGEGGAEGAPSQYAAAYGAALARLGEVFHRAHLRREDLAYSGKFERLELPLAVAGLLLVAFLSVFLIINYRVINNREAELYWYLASIKEYVMGNPKKGTPGYLKRPPENLQKYFTDALEDKDVERTRFEQIGRTKTMISNEIIAKQKLLGQDKDIAKPQSALEGLTLVLGVLSEMGDRVGRVGLREMASDYSAGSGNKPDAVTVKISLSFYADDALIATEHYNAFLNEVQSKPWCTDAPSKQTKPLDSGGGIYVEGLTVTLDLSKLQREEVVAAK
ncbi:MAG: hypothetical protein FJ299_00860 [Planctomycetes bacterium]|nr:hypothetical protein [Planctomycetota bacterium]